MNTKSIENAVLARDVGKTIKWQHLENGKLDVNTGRTLTVGTDGSIDVDITKLPRVADKDARTGDVTIHNPDGNDVVLETPRVRIGVNDNWFIDGVDTGKSSRGLQGNKGDKGEPGAPGQPGRDGHDGVAPTVTVKSSEGGTHTITIDDGKGNVTNTVVRDGVSGVSPLVDAKRNETNNTVTITFFHNDDDSTELNASSHKLKEIIIPAGAKGDKGDPGSKGDAGKSAYDVWKEANSNLPDTSKDAFFKSLKGEKGDSSDAGQASEISVADGLRGNGTITDPLKVNAEDLKGDGIKVENNNFAVDYDPDTMELTSDGKLRAKQQPAQAGGLDCAAIAALPKAAWKPDTSILVNQDGECKRLVPNENIFTDVVVDLAASKQNVEIPKNQSETVNIIATVTNAGANPTGEVLVTLTKPQLGIYQLGTPTTNNIGETKTGELTWKIPAMASGKSLVITLPVTFSKTGSFSFGLQATSTIDTNKQNNTKTMTFTVTERIMNDGTNTNYVPTGADCPLIIATDLTHNQRLNVYTTGTGEDFRQFGKYINVFADGRGFAGKQIKLEGASTVVVTSSTKSRDTSYLHSRYFMHEDAYTSVVSSANITSSNNIWNISSSYSPSQNLVIAIAGFAQGKRWGDLSNNAPVDLINMGTFDPQTQIFTFSNDLLLPTHQTSYNKAPYHCVIWCRPAGKDCKWQGIPIVLGIKDTLPETTSKIYEFTKVKGNVTDTDSGKTEKFYKTKPDITKAANFVGAEKPSDLLALVYDDLSHYGKYESGAKHTVTVTSGEEAQFTIHATGNKNELPKYISTGKTHTSYDDSTKTLNVTVAADATATDSIYWDDLKVIVK